MLTSAPCVLTICDWSPMHLSAPCVHCQHMYHTHTPTGCVASLLALVLSFFVGDPRPAAPQPDVFAQQAAKRRAQHSASRPAPQQYDNDNDNEEEEGEEDDTAPLLESSTGRVSAPPNKALSWRRMLNRQGSLLQGIDGWELFKYCVMCVFTVNLKTIFRYGCMSSTLQICHHHRCHFTGTSRSVRLFLAFSCTCLHACLSYIQCASTHPPTHHTHAGNAAQVPHQGIWMRHAHRPHLCYQPNHDFAPRACGGRCHRHPSPL